MLDNVKKREKKIFFYIKSAETLHYEAETLHYKYAETLHYHIFQNQIL